MPIHHIQSRVYQYKYRLYNNIKQNRTVRQSRLYQYKYRLYEAEQDSTSEQAVPVQIQTIWGRTGQYVRVRCNKYKYRLYEAEQDSTSE